MIRERDGYDMMIRCLAGREGGGREGWREKRGGGGGGGKRGVTNCAYVVCGLSEWADTR